MVLPTVNDISGTIKTLEVFKKAKQNYWKAYAAKQKFDGLTEPERQQLWLNYVQPSLNIVMAHFEKFQLDGCIQLYGTGKLKSKKTINIMVDGKGADSAESDDIAINEIIKELETVKQNLLNKLQLSETATSGDKAGETKQNSTPAKIINIEHFQGVLGDVQQPENLQIGDNTSIHKHDRSEEKKKGIIWKILKIIVIIVAIITFIGTIVGILAGLHELGLF